MFAVIRANLGDTPNTVWSDDVVRNLFNPNVPYSFAHYWTRNSFTAADMRYFMFDPIAYADPRPGKEHDPARQALVEEAIKEVTRRFNPDWDLFDAAILLFTGQVDLFGGGAYAVPTRPGSDRTSMAGAVLDPFAPFSSMVQEIGHALGYNHEFGLWDTQEYASPYSAMSEEFSPSNTWNRAADLRLTTLPQPAFGRDEPLRTIGPYIPAAQFLAAKSPTLSHPDSVHTAAPDFVTPWPIRLVALDKAIADWPTRRLCVAVIPASPTRARTYYLEVRRKSDYDQALHFGVRDAALAGLVIHSWDPVTFRVHYEGALAFDDQAGDLDYRSFNGRFIVRFQSYDADRAEASLRIYGDDAWRITGIDFDEPHVDERLPVYGSWIAVQASPCGAASTGTYEYRTVTATTEVRLAVTSFGFERPVYSWRLNDVALTGPSGFVRLELLVKKIDGSTLVDAGVQPCDISYVTADNRLTLSTSAQWAALALQLQVTVSESSHEVVQNAYPDRVLATDFRIDNVSVEWDDRYTRAKLECWRRYWEQERGFGPGQVRPKFDREPQKIAPEIIAAALNEMRNRVSPVTQPELTPRQLVDAVHRVDPQIGLLLRTRLNLDR